MTAILMVAVLAFLGILTETSLNVTFPEMMKDFKVSLDTIQWTTTGYLLAIAILMISSSYLNKRFTARAIFLFASGSFLIGSLLCLFSSNFEIMLLGRIISSCGAGLATPLMFNLVTELMPREKIGFYMGLAGLVLAMAPSLGPSFGGIIAYYFNWRVIFSISSVLAIIVILIGLRVVGKYHEVSHPSFDWVRYIVISLFMVDFTLMINHLSSGFDLQFFLYLVFAILSMGLFIHLSKNSQKTLINLAIFKDAAFVYAMLAFFLIQFINIGVSFVLPNYVQIVNGASTLAGGLMLLPGSVIFSLMTPYFGHLYDEKGAKLPLYLGGSVLLVAIILLALFGMVLNPWIICLIYSIMACGMRMAFNNTLTVGIESSPKKLHADATAIMQTGQQFAGSIGTSVLATIISFSQSTRHGSKAILMAQGCEVAFIFVTFIAILIMLCYWQLFTKVDKK